jgi:hypothetical protein
LIIVFGGLELKLLQQNKWWCWLTGGMDWEEREGEVEIVGRVGRGRKNNLKKVLTVDGSSIRVGSVVGSWLVGLVVGP